MLLGSWGDAGAGPHEEVGEVRLRRLRSHDPLLVWCVWLFWLQGRPYGPWPWQRSIDPTFTNPATFAGPSDPRRRDLSKPGRPGGERGGLRLPMVASFLRSMA